MAVEVTEAIQVTAEVVEAFERLTPQLSSSNPPPSAEALQAVASADATRLLVARADGAIVGSLTLVLVPHPHRAASHHRGRGGGTSSSGARAWAGRSTKSRWNWPATPVR